MKRVYSLQFTVYSRQWAVYSLFMMLFTVHCSLFTVCLAESISSTELLNNTNQYNNKIVTYEGEVIGDVLGRGRYTWLNISDGENTIGVWFIKEMVPDIHYKGRYGSKGDIVTIRGIFHKTCPQHGGDLDIHAEKIIKHTYGESIKYPIDLRKTRTAVALCGVLFVVSGWWVLVRRMKITK